MTLKYLKLNKIFVFTCSEYTSEDVLAFAFLSNQCFVVFSQQEKNSKSTYPAESGTK